MLLPLQASFRHPMGCMAQELLFTALSLTSAEGQGNLPNALREQQCVLVHMCPISTFPSFGAYAFLFTAKSTPKHSQHSLYELHHKGTGAKGNPEQAHIPTKAGSARTRDCFCSMWEGMALSNQPTQQHRPWTSHTLHVCSFILCLKLHFMAATPPLIGAI